MSYLVRGKNEFFVSRLGEELASRLNGEVVRVEGEEIKKLNLGQGGLFAEERVFLCRNVLRRQFKEKLKELASQPKVIFLEILPQEKKQKERYRREFYLPQNLKPRIFEADKLIFRYSFWRKLALKEGVNLSEAEFYEALRLCGEHPEWLFSALKQKALVPPLSLKELLSSWTVVSLWQLSDALKEKNKAFAVLRQLYQWQVKGERLWGYLVRYFLRLYLVAKGIELELHPYAQQRLKEDSRQYSLSELERILSKLFALEKKFKTGFFEGKRGGWEVLISFLLWFFSQRSLRAGEPI